ncbi:MAG TPA: cytochrome c biogenesis protein CcsA [Bacteroidota bacterium]|nr:cytochrome c biogenesis protein CcsA [Bacteroidota bacterium]
MITSLRILETALPAAYFCAIWAYAKAFFSGNKVAESVKTPLLGLCLVLHGGYLIVRTSILSHPPITSVFEIFSVIAFTIALAYLFIEWQTGNRTTGYFILIFSFFFQLASSLFIKENSEVPSILRSNLLGVHVSSALFGMAAITVSAVYGLLYLMLYHEIKSSRFGVIYQRLPNLEMLERMSFTSAAFGFAFLTVAIIIGIVWLPRSVPNFSYTDPKLWGTFALWLIYGIGFTARSVAGWRGRKIIVLSMFGFALAIFSMTLINVLFTSFHKFY